MEREESHWRQGGGLSDVSILQRFGRGQSICARTVAICYSCIMVGMRQQTGVELLALSSPRERGGYSATFRGENEVWLD